MSNHGPLPPISVRHSLAQAWVHIRGFRTRIFGLLLVGAATSALMVLGPLLTGDLVAALVEQGRPAGEGASLATSLGWLKTPPTALVVLLQADARAAQPLWLALLAISAFLVVALSSPLVDWRRERALGQVEDRLRLQLYRKQNQLFVLEPTRDTGTLVTLIDHLPREATGVIRLATLEVPGLAIGVALAIGGMLTADWTLGLGYLVFLVAMQFALPSLAGIDRSMQDLGGRIQLANMDVSSRLTQQLEARGMIAALRVERTAENDLSQAFEARLGTRLQMQWLQSLRSSFTVATALGLPALVVAGWYLEPDASALAGRVVALQLLAVPLTQSLQGVVGAYTALRQTSASMAMIDAELRRRVPALAARPLGDAPPRLEVRDLTVALEDGRVLHQGLTFRVEAGATLAIAGRGGTGKSVLLDVIGGRFRGRCEGEIRWNDQLVDAREMLGHRDRAIRLNQTPQMLRTTVQDYVCYGMTPEDSSAVDIDQVLAQVGLDRPLSRRVEPHQVILEDFQPSGFQKQALRLAQLLVRPRPPLILLDEPDSAMSMQDAREVQRLIIELLGKTSTVLLVSHVPFLLPDETSLLFLDGRGAAQQGTHRSLETESTAYRTLVESTEQPESPAGVPS